MNIKPCNCGSGLERFELVDARGIFCTFICDKCESEKRRRYRPEIFEDRNYDAIEAIEPEDY